MNLNEQAEKYLEGLLGHKERKLFETELKENKELQEYLRKRILLDKELSEYFKAKITKELSAEIENDILEYGKFVYENPDESSEKFRKSLQKTINQNSKGRNFSLIMGIAASISLLMIIGIGSYKKISESKRADRNYSLYQDFFNPGADANLKKIDYFFYSGMEISEKDSIYEKYKLNSEKNITRSSDINETEVLSIALISMQRKDYESAIHYLKYILKNRDSEIFDISRWYYSLCLIARNKPGEAKKILQSLSQNNTVYTREAEQLLDSINAL
jgi:hypothetical protein